MGSFSEAVYVLDGELVQSPTANKVRKASLEKAMEKLTKKAHSIITSSV